MSELSDTEINQRFASLLETDFSDVKSQKTKEKKTEPDRQSEPIVGYRLLRVEALGSTVVVLPTDKNHAKYIEVTGQEAVCLTNHLHRPPVEDCHCGWHIYKTLEQITDMKPDHFPEVIAEVEISGTILDFGDEYRAKYQRITKIMIQKGFCQGKFICKNPAVGIVFPRLPEKEWSNRFAGLKPSIDPDSVEKMSLICEECSENYARVATLKCLADRWRCKVVWFGQEDDINVEVEEENLRQEENKNNAY